MAIGKEEARRFAEELYKKYYVEDMGCAVLNTFDFAREVTELEGKFSTYRIREWRKALELWGYLVKISDRTIAIRLPEKEEGEEEPPKPVV